MSIVILNFNGLADSIACLESLRAAELHGAKVLLLDNGSEAADREGLRRWNEATNFFARWRTIPTEEPLPRGHTLLLSEENHGFARGNNLATRLAQTWGDEEVLLLNNDTVVAPDFLTRLLEGRARRPGAVLIPQIQLHGRPGFVWNCGGELRWPGRKVYNYENAPVASVPTGTDLPVTFVTGCALLYRPAETGLLTERFFFGEEDMEFSLRLRQLGVSAYCIPTSVVRHKVGSSLAGSYRKSEINILKRLVNLRVNRAGAEIRAGYAYHRLNLLRLLLTRYGRSPLTAVAAVGRVVRRSKRIEYVGKEYCVDYVRGGPFPPLGPVTAGGPATTIDVI